MLIGRLNISFLTILPCRAAGHVFSIYSTYLFKKTEIVFKFHRIVRTGGQALERDAPAIPDFVKLRKAPVKIHDALAERAIRKRKAAQL